MNTCLSQRQRESRREHKEYSGGEEMPYLPEPPGGDADPEAAALSAERRQEIVAYAVRRAYVSAFWRQAEQVVRGLTRG